MAAYRRVYGSHHLQVVVVVVVPFNGLWSGTTQVGVYQKKQLLWIFMEQGRIMEAEAPTVRVGATPTGLTAPSPPQPLRGFLQAGCPSCHPTNSVKALKAHHLQADCQKTRISSETLLSVIEYGLPLPFTNLKSTPMLKFQITVKTHMLS